MKIVLDHKVEDLDAEMTDGRFDAGFIAIGAHLSQAHRDPGARCRADARRRRLPARGRDPRGAEARSRSRSTAAATRPWTRRAWRAGSGATEAMIIYRRDRAHMPAHEFEADGGRSRGREDPLAAHDQIDRAAPRFTVEVMEVDEQGRPQPTGRVRDARGRRADHGARPGQRHALPRRRSTASSSRRTARSWSTPT